MSQLRIRGVSSLLAVLIVALVFSQLALSQTVQHRQTDLQFVSRMNQQATEMSVRIDELELSLGQTSTAQPQPQPQAQSKEHRSDCGTRIEQRQIRIRKDFEMNLRI